MPQYRVLTGLDYPPNKRAEPGAIVSDLPAASVKWLKEQGHIEPASASSPAPASKPLADEGKP